MFAGEKVRSWSAVKKRDDFYQKADANVRAVVDSWVRQHPHAPPLSFVLALQDGTRLRLRTHAGVWHIVTIQAGDILLFDGAVWHNGLGYPTGNDRVHGYLRTAGYNAGTRAVTFWFCDDTP